MINIMMQLGSYQFGINTAAYQELRRVSEYRWSPQERFGQNDALQFTGKNTETITLTGVIFPQFKGGRGQMNSMRSVADRGQPLLMVDGLGGIHGRWVIERVEESQAVFAKAGAPKRQQFTMTLRKYSDAV